MASYLLAMTDPKKYPFCKPRVYNKSAVTLIGEEAKKSDPVEKWIYCKDFYSRVLKLLEKDYGLANGNLLDVHSLLYLFMAKEDEVIEKKESIPSTTEITINDQQNLIYDLLMEKYNVVLYGPPGTGKTREAFQLRLNYGELSSGRIRFIR